LEFVHSILQPHNLKHNIDDIEQTLKCEVF